MKSNRLLLIIFFLIVFVVGLGIWQARSATNRESSSDQENTHRSRSDSSGASDTSSFIEQLRQREFSGGKITVEETISDNSEYTSYIFSYPSDDLTIFGSMNVPKGKGPFSVIILNHGYYNPSRYTSGDGTATMADILARNGYLTVASDYRGHGKSDNDQGRRGGHRPEYAIDVLNLIASLKSLDKADIAKIGMWGHSMGGEVSLRTIEATDQVKAVALWAPTSGNAGDNHAFYGGHDARPTTPDVEGISPINYLRYISAPISLHQGTVDTEVNPEWAKELYDALKKEGKQVEYFEYEGQDHNFRNLGWDLISERTLNFYDKYLKK
jgi:uncharacterized protein